MSPTAMPSTPMPATAILEFNKILLPVDLQAATPRVVHQAAVVARQYNSEIVLLHVVTPMSYAAGNLTGNYIPATREDLLAELLRQAERQLDQALKPELQGLAVKRVLRKGDPAEEIVRTAREEKAGLIVMPTHGFGVFRRFLLGSVAAKVLHDSEVPVWTGAHLEEKPEHDFAVKNILCAIDLSAHSATTAARAAALAAKFGAELKLVNVVPGQSVEVLGPDGEAFPEWTEAVTTATAQRMAKLQEQIGTKAAVLMETGDPPKAIAQAAKNSKADLLIVGRRAPGKHLGGTAYGIIRESHIPVLSL